MSDEVQGPPTPKCRQQEFKGPHTFKVPAHLTCLVSPTSSGPKSSVKVDGPVLHPNLPMVNTDLPVTSPQGSESDSQRTPLSSVISSFDNVQTLPTPMAYTPPAIQPRSPIDPLPVVKRRDSSRSKNFAISPVQQQRYLSELFPIPDSASQRVTSLPTVSEGTSIIDNSTEEVNISTLNVDDDDTLTGYLVGRYKEPLFWHKVNEIGSGNFSTVFLYESLDQAHADLRQVAVKRIKYPEELIGSDGGNKSRDQELLSRLESSLTRELSVLKSLSHPCVVKLFGVNNPIFLESNGPLRDLMKQNSCCLPPCDMIMSYCAGGDLLTAATECGGNIDMWLLQRIFAELIVAVKYLHESQVIHRDLKLENILLKYPLSVLIDMRHHSSVFWQRNFIQLADFGLCKRIEPGELCTARCGSEDYVSPEILMGVPYDGRLTDVWALGVILYGLLESRLPFDPPPNATARQRNRATAHRIARFDWRWYQWSNSDIAAKEIVENALTRKTKRWMIDDIYRSQFVKEVVTQLAF